MRLLLAGANNLRDWFTKVRKIKAIYHCLNLFRYMKYSNYPDLMVNYPVSTSARRLWLVNAGCPRPRPLGLRPRFNEEPI